MAKELSGMYKLRSGVQAWEVTSALDCNTLPR